MEVTAQTDEAVDVVIDRLVRPLWEMLLRGGEEAQGGHGGGGAEGPGCGSFDDGEPPDS